VKITIEFRDDDKKNYKVEIDTSNGRDYELDRCVKQLTRFIADMRKP